ncbi:tolB protein precursor, periplasmic protein involved in the tonb-independent uptake of group A colicins [hydrothermal vent metagenome]|uniref:TolB protein, periplasmic protein involved in the tonb-independent uptake of group A colicins n=1 Tax=hydrothermal vent metagenome TaxID=652676 RepID=A0A3B1CNM5_9ZZZZ
MRQTSGRFVIVAVGLFLMACENSAEDAMLSVWASMPDERIVFASRADSSEGELYSIDKSGSITRLTYNSRHENNPALSPDGTKVAFHAGDESNPLTYEIYIIDLLTGVELRLTNNAVIDGHPDWSPDGSKIVFASFRDSFNRPAGTADIYVMNANGSDKIRLISSAWEDNDPEWSPNGAFIAFKSTRNTQTAAREEIFVANADGSNIQRLTSVSGWGSDHDPSWSPDSSSIVFERFEGTRPWTDIANIELAQTAWRELVPWNIFRVDLSGNAVRLTAHADQIAWLPTYSIDGSRIMYFLDEMIFQNSVWIGAWVRMYVMSNDGANPQPLIEDNGHTLTQYYYDWN